MAAAARECGVRIVTGDTKVVERSRGDGLFITTTGIGQPLAPGRLEPARVCPGDAILLSGDIGRHGMAVMAAREGLEFESAIVSDSAPLHRQVLALIAAGVELHCMRDCTRGGLATALIEIAAAGKVDCEIEESAVQIRPDVRAACSCSASTRFTSPTRGASRCLSPAATANAPCRFCSLSIPPPHGSGA